MTISLCLLFLFLYFFFLLVMPTFSRILLSFPVLFILPNCLQLLSSTYKYIWLCWVGRWVSDCHIWLFLNKHAVHKFATYTKHTQYIYIHSCVCVYDQLFKFQHCEGGTRRHTNSTWTFEAQTHNVNKHIYTCTYVYIVFYRGLCTLLWFWIHMWICWRVSVLLCVKIHFVFWFSLALCHNFSSI